MNHARWSRWGLSLVAALLLAACSCVPKIPAKGTFHGEVINTTVDAEVARYYLESYLAGKRADPALDSKIEAATRQYANSLPSRDELAALSKTYSVDFAALFFADRLLARTCNQVVNQRFADYLANPRARAANSAQYVVLFVPGWDYVTSGHLTGADFAEPRRLATAFGLDNELVPISPTGSVEENARVLARVVTERVPSGKKILIAGASSAGPAIHLALGKLLTKKDLQSVKAWINLGGILQGSPLIDYAQHRPQVWLFDLAAWWQGWKREDVLSMAAASSRTRFARLSIDADILIINYVGIPLSGQLSKFAGDKYPLLRDAGPNDGLTLLTDAIAPRSRTVVAIGRDHFFAEDPRINAKTIAMMALVIVSLEGQPLPRCE